MRSFDIRFWYYNKHDTACFYHGDFQGEDMFDCLAAAIGHIEEEEHIEKPRLSSLKVEELYATVRNTDAALKTVQS